MNIILQLVLTCVDLSTLASVVTTLATMGKDRENSSGADTSDEVPNGETSPESTGLDQAAKAFDALTKALQPQLDQVCHLVVYLFFWRLVFIVEVDACDISLYFVDFCITNRFCLMQPSTN